jgi:hypothetical protein
MGALARCVQSRVAAMRPLSKALLLVAGVHAAAMTAVPAWAQDAAPTPPETAPVPPPVPLPAQVQPAAVTASPDVIYLKGGGMLRGTLVDAIPGSRARIQLATGEIASVPWEQIDHIGQAPGQDQPPPPPRKPPTPRAPTQPAPTPAAVQGSVKVHVEGAEGAQLQYGETGHDDWKSVCDLPCDASVPAGGHYRVVGDDIRPTPDFELKAGAGEHENIHVKAASKTWSTLGAIAAGGGGIAAYIGFVIGVTASSTPDTSQTPTSARDAAMQSDQRGTATAGWVTCAIGLGAVIGGLIVVFSNTKTTVAQDAGSESSARLAPDAFKPTPSWREANVIDRSAPPVVGLPLLSGSF